jgi:hypothetical protein
MVMRIRTGRRIPGEMLPASENACGKQSIMKGSGKLNHLRHGSSPATAAQRIVRLIVKRDVQDRAKIEIESKQPEQIAGKFPVGSNEILVGFLPKLLRVGWFIADYLQARNAAAFLINGNNWLDGTEVAQIVHQLSELTRGADISTK